MRYYISETLYSYKLFGVLFNFEGGVGVGRGGQISLNRKLPLHYTKLSSCNLVPYWKAFSFYLKCNVFFSPLGSSTLSNRIYCYASAPEFLSSSPSWTLKKLLAPSYLRILVPPPPHQKVCETQIPYYCNFAYIVTSLKRLG